MRPASRHLPRRSAQRGAAAVEFAIVALVFFMIIFGILEFARIIYMFNTLADVTRSAARSAANIDWHDTTELNRARQRAIFRDSPGLLAFGAPITDQHIRIEYLHLKQQGGTITMEPTPSGLMPSTPGVNRHNCLTNPYGTATSTANTCIRLVRARICRPAGADCEPVHYEMLFPFLNLGVRLPTSTTVVNAETLGYRLGDAIDP